MKSPLYQQLLDRVQQSLVYLPDKPEDTPEAVLNSLWSLVEGTPLSTSAAADASEKQLSDAEHQDLLKLIARLAKGEPAAHIVGRQNFCGIEMIATAAALIPRKETELLVQVAADRLKRSGTEPDTIVDVCCGSGNVAIALAKDFSKTNIIGSDMSTDAVTLANRNAEFVGISSQVSFVQGDMLEPFCTREFEQAVDLITCNPPYISSAKVEQMPSGIAEHEPKLAFDGGPFGLSMIQNLVKNAPQILKPGGWLVFEVGLGQAEPLMKRFAKNRSFQQCAGHSDEANNVRVVSMQVHS